MLSLNSKSLIPTGRGQTIGTQTSVSLVSSTTLWAIANLKLNISKDMTKADDAYVKAKLTLYPTKEGGRSHFILSGFRPNHVFEYVDGQVLTTYIGEIQFDASEKIEPGEEMEVSVRFLMTPELKKYLQVGRKWWLHEGARKIGEAVILEYNCP